LDSSYNLHIVEIEGFIGPDHELVNNVNEDYYYDVHYTINELTKYCKNTLPIFYEFLFQYNRQQKLKDILG
jgi:hypothetical protein